MLRMSRIQWPRAKFTAMALLAVMLLGFGALAQVAELPPPATAGFDTTESTLGAFKFCRAEG